MPHLDSRRILQLVALAACSVSAWAQESAQPSMAERLAASRAALAASPDDASILAARSGVLLAAGLGERARETARKAVEAGPPSAEAYLALGRALSHDNVGRPYQGDFDYAEAETALLRAVKLNPEGVQARLELAMLYEHDPTGWRYAPEARLGEAIRIYASIVQETQAPAAIGRLIDALFRDRRYEEIQTLLTEIGPERDPVTQIAVLAAIDGPPTAVSWTTRTLPGDQQRRGLMEAANRLMRVRAYKAAAGLVAAAARGASNSDALFQQAAGLERIRPHTSAPPVVGPAAPGFRLLIDTYRGADMEQLFENRSRHSRRLLENPAYVREYRQTLVRIREGLRVSGSTPDMVLDLAMATWKSAVSGDAGMGYKVDARVNGRASTYFVIEEDGVPKVLDIISSPGENLTDLAYEVLARVEGGRVDRARQLLVWAYEMRQQAMQRSDDPLSGPVFARFWEPDAVVGVDEVRWAAATLLAESVYDAEASIEILRPALEATEKPKDRERFQIALATAYSKLFRHEELLEVSRPLLEAYPDSDIAFGLAALPLMQLERFDELESLLQSRLRKDPQELTTLRMQMQAAVQQADLGTARQAAAQIGKVRELGPAELNNVSWTALVAGQVDGEAIAQIEKALELTEANPNRDLYNSAAALYAEAGRLEDARQAVLTSMRIAGMITPDSNSWYVFGRIAEGYGEPEAARACYERVERPERESELRSSPYWLAERGLERIAAGG